MQQINIQLRVIGIIVILKEEKVMEYNISKAQFK